MPDSNIYTVTEIPEFQAIPMATAFTCHAIQSLFHIAKPSQQNMLRFTPALKFGVHGVRYGTAFISKHEGKHYQGEFFIVFTKEGYPAAMVSRMFVDGELQPESFSFTQYEMHEYHHECILKAIAEIDPPSDWV